MNTYRRFIRPVTLAVMAQMYTELDAQMQGTTPDDDLTVIAATLVHAKARRVLQFGTFLGYSCLMIGDLVAQNDGMLVSVDTNTEYNRLAKTYTDRAGLGNHVMYLDGASTDPAVKERLMPTPWDAIYLDTTHQYGQTVAELQVIETLSGPNTVVMLHDCSTHAQSLDQAGLGGVKRAFSEFLDTHKDWQGMIYEQPTFTGLFGVGVMRRRA